MTTQTTYDVHVIEHASARPLEHSADVAEHLTGTLRDMAAMYRLFCEVETPADLERLEIGPERFDTEPRTDVAHESADAFALEVRMARWDDASGELEPDSFTGMLRTARFLLTGGGPNVWLTVDFSHIGDGEVERVTLERYWGSEADRAETTRPDACALAYSFVHAFFSVE